MQLDWYEQLAYWVDRGDGEADWREVDWTREPRDTGWLAYSAEVNNQRLVIRREPGGLWDITAFDADDTRQWGLLTFTEDAAKFLAIIHADLSYLDMEQAAGVMTEFLEAIDPDYLDIDTITDHGWEGFVDEDETCGNDHFATLTTVVLVDGTVLKYDEEEMSWTARFAL